MGATFTTETGGVTATKSVEFADGDEAKIKFDITSTWSESVTIRLQDAVPDHEIQVRSDELDHWTSDEETVTYERTLEPEESVTTAYRLAAPDAADASELAEQLTAPSLDVAEPLAETDDSFTRGAGGAVATFDGLDAAETTVSADEAASGGDSSAATDDHAVSAEDDAVSDSLGDFLVPEADVALTEPVNGDGDAHEPDDGAADETVAAQASDGAPDAGVVSGSGDPSGADTFQAESSEAEREADPDSAETAGRGGGESTGEEQSVRARQGPTGAGEERASLDARVRYLQTQFQELAAYIDAMEVFIDEHGTGEQVLTALSSDMETVKDRLDRVDETQQELLTRLDTVETKLDSLQTDVERREEAVDDELDDLAESVDAVTAARQDMETDIEDLKSFQEKLQGAFQHAPE